MTHPRIRPILIGIALAFASGPAGGQTVVYDPSNYAQNMLQAARALQQINNQVTSLQNQTQMLLNQVRNLTSLPYSALQTIDQSIVRTQQLLNQAQRLAYDVNQIDQAFGRSYPQSYAAAWQRQHDDVRTIRVSCDLPSEQPARFVTVAKQPWPNEFWLYAHALSFPSRPTAFRSIRSAQRTDARSCHLHHGLSHSRGNDGCQIRFP